MSQGVVEQIHLAPEKAAPMAVVNQARALAGQGLEGDHRANPGRKPGQQLTLIEAEAIEAAQRDHDIALAQADSRRNIITRGIALNHLVDREFVVGSVRARGVELCEPCGHMEKLSGKPGACRALVHRGGLRAEILTDGVIRIGDAVETPKR